MLFYCVVSCCRQKVKCEEADLWKCTLMMHFFQPSDWFLSAGLLIGQLKFRGGNQEQT